VAAAPAAPVAAVPAGDGQAAPELKQRVVYSANFSHTGDASRKPLAAFTRENFAELLKRCHVEVFATRVANDNAENQVQKIIVFQEKHADGNVHHYGVVLCKKPYRTSKIARA
jgi:hypothetical protein